MQVSYNYGGIHNGKAKEKEEEIFADQSGAGTGFSAEDAGQSGDAVSGDNGLPGNVQATYDFTRTDHPQ